jgi:hypothetical protein
MTEGEVVTPKWFYQESMVFKYMDSPLKISGTTTEGVDTY